MTILQHFWITHKQASWSTITRLLSLQLCRASASTKQRAQFLRHFDTNCHGYHGFKPYEFSIWNFIWTVRIETWKRNFKWKLSNKNWLKNPFFNESKRTNNKKILLFISNDYLSAFQEKPKILIFPSKSISLAVPLNYKLGHSSNTHIFRMLCRE